MALDLNWLPVIFLSLATVPSARSKKYLYLRQLIFVGMRLKIQTIKLTLSLLAIPVTTQMV